jgi:serine/threonine protein kinase
LAPDSPGRNCVACLLRLGMDIQAMDFDELFAEVEAIETADGASAESWPQLTNYRILRELGEGGFGVVYAAEQLRPVRREVAVKVIKPGMDTRGVMAHFASERQALAVMDHPGIARVFDAGATGAGRAFFAMELVAGKPLIDYCDSKKLGIRERVEIFIQICHAVQHAHQKGIIHRDLKPGNVIVTEHDGLPLPKVIDFGIAKATDGQRLGEQTIFTAFEPFIGTPAYMSPEQADFGGTDIDTRSDIYSLGVMLYELLAGRPPFENLSRAGLEETRRRIREEQPARPSALVAALPAAGQSIVAKNRTTDPPKLIRTLRGDLDWVTIKALEKERARRYASAAGFAADLRRCLDAEPITARPPSAWYRLQKFAGRNKTAVVAAAVVLLAIVAAAVVSAVAAVQARRAEQRALIEATKTRQTAEFLIDAFDAITPEQARGHDTTLLRGVLDTADAGIKGQLSAGPEVKADFLRIIGWTYFKIGQDDKAIADLTEAVAIARGLPQEKLLLCVSLDWLTYAELNHYPDNAEADAREAYALQTQLEASYKHGSPEAQGLATYGLALARVLITRGKLDEGIAVLRQSLAYQEKELGDTNKAVANSYIGLGEVEEQRHEFPEAGQAYRKSLDIRRKLDGGDSPDTINALLHVGDVVAEQGDLHGAEAIYRQSLDLSRKFFTSADRDLTKPLVKLAATLTSEGNLDEPQKLLQEAMVVWVKATTVRPVRMDKGTIAAVGSLATALDQHGQKDKADALRAQLANPEAFTVGPPDGASPPP